MIIFGIDPGTACTGYGVIKVVNNSISWVDSGVVMPGRTGLELSERLEIIYDGLREKMLEHEPDRVCIEEAFYAKNVHTTLILGHARGVAMLAASKTGATVHEYSPREIKKMVTGSGNAAKEQVEYMVKMLISPPCLHSKSDAYDALAIAICDFHCNRHNRLIGKFAHQKIKRHTTVRKRCR
ncbi:Crossover junction endodeoxyribonuclease RuvC [Chitinispirillum alkaliphilum]|nr:Crossover junction endodeoxyribonuclease RuvC [Chitinispirillum alkaliphilum]